MHICEKCQNTGSVSHGEYLDCTAPHCTAATDRAEFNGWLEQMGWPSGSLKEWWIFGHGQREAADACEIRIAALVEEKTAAEQRAFELAESLSNTKQELEEWRFTNKVDELGRQLEAALAQRAGSEAVPVHQYRRKFTDQWNDVPAQMLDFMRSRVDADLYECRTLYTTPPAAPLGLTDTEIVAICERECGWLAGAKDSELIKFARAILAAATQPATDAALQRATELAKAIWRDNYKDTAPQWEPLPDLMGVLSQIDNMVCGMSRTTDADKRDAERLDFVLDNSAFICTIDDGMYQLMNQDEDEEYFVISGEGEAFRTKRDAIDAAIAAASAKSN